MLPFSSMSFHLLFSLYKLGKLFLDNLKQRCSNDPLRLHLTSDNSSQSSPDSTLSVHSLQVLQVFFLANGSVATCWTRLEYDITQLMSWGNAQLIVFLRHCPGNVKRETCYTNVRTHKDTHIHLPDSCLQNIEAANKDFMSGVLLYHRYITVTFNSEI